MRIKRILGIEHPEDLWKKTLDAQFLRTCALCSRLATYTDKCCHIHTDEGVGKIPYYISTRSYAGKIVIVDEVLGTNPVPLDRCIVILEEGLIPEKHSIIHLDGDEFNNHPDNLKKIPVYMFLFLQTVKEKERRQRLSSGLIEDFLSWAVQYRLL